MLYDLPMLSVRQRKYFMEADDSSMWLYTHCEVGVPDEIPHINGVTGWVFVGAKTQIKSQPLINVKEWSVTLEEVLVLTHMDSHMYKYV